MINNLSSVVSKPIWSKCVCLWIGSEKTLAKLLSKEKREDLDVLDLLTSVDMGSCSDSEIKDHIYYNLDQYVAKLSESVTERCILTVKSTALLARYRIGLKPFYDWFGGNRKMTILILPAELQVRLPVHVEKDIKLDCKAIIGYLSSCLDNSKLVFREE